MMREEIATMSMSEKIILMEAIWDSLETEIDELQPPDWHQDVLSDRIERLNTGQVKLISLQELKNRIR
ncbi:addiction module protein [Methylocucumis oryzae]|uniref:Addiction module protein n=1 Tax=Methylocucumis oryzae TaxID=1632867 RepID=A0A0F3IEZ1_9GAMM|nr:addiction module protein [Methylocucumis oryzae]KJV05321.1 hypothetical protein VZ94_19065 [Methylocucumis oryzae]